MRFLDRPYLYATTLQNSELSQIRARHKVAARISGVLNATLQVAHLSATAARALATVTHDDVRRDLAYWLASCPCWDWLLQLMMQACFWLQGRRHPVGRRAPA